MTDHRGWMGRILGGALAVMVGTIGPSWAAGGDFAPVKIVNDQAISGYELGQRIAFLTLLKQPGDIEAEAMNGLIEDRLRNAAAKAMQISLSSEDVTAGMTEFASRANLSAEEFIKAIGQAGVDRETFRDFVAAGVLWRQVVRQKFDGKVNISQAAIDRSLAQFSFPVAQTVTLAEISMAATGAGRTAALTAARELRTDIVRGRDFAEAARAVSDGMTAGQGGVLAKQTLSSLPDDVAKAVRGLAVDGVSQPVILADKVVIYKMLANAQEPTTITAATQVDYAELLLPNSDAGLNMAADVRGRVDTCDDLYTVARDLPEGSLTRQTVGLGAVPADIAGAVQLLDAGEISTSVTRGGARVLVMLCNRGAPQGSQPSRDEVKLMLTNQKLAAMATVYLEELRADALITDP